MNILSILSKLGISVPTPKWLISFFMLFKASAKRISLGTRVVIFDAKGAVFLVRHSYMKGWYFPGGGVDHWEVPADAAKREILEEAGMITKGEPELYGLFLNNKLAIPDYVACYIVRDWEWAEGANPNAPSHDGEITEAGFFPLDALPEGITRATQERLDEISNGLPASKHW